MWPQGVMLLPTESCAIPGCRWVTAHRSAARCGVWRATASPRRIGDHSRCAKVSLPGA